MLNELAKEIHANAVAHGWWEKPRTFAEVVALCHSELSEALEEYRNDRPMVYRICGGGKTPCHEGDCGDWYDGKCDLGILNAKPEGIAVELADCIIRILDYCAHEGVDIERRVKNLPLTFAEMRTLPELICECHEGLSVQYRASAKNCGCFALCIVEIKYWLEMNGLNLLEIIRLKHEYNKTRPHRHGGKVI